MRNIATTSIVFSAVLASAATSIAQPRDDSAAVKGNPKQRSNDQPATKPPPIEPEAIDALKKMGAFLRQQQSFAVRTNAQTDFVLDTGQKVQLDSHDTLRVDGANHLRADTVTDRMERQYFYDGKQFTMYSPRVGYYAVVDLPPQADVHQLANLLEAKYDVALPLVDLLRWGTEDADLKEITSATYVGPAKIDGVDTEQYAFRQAGLDWQIWIERGDKPVPRRLVLTTTDQPTHPQYAVDMTWTLGAKEDPTTFAFTPPKDAAKIAIAERAKTQPTTPGSQPKK